MHPVAWFWWANVTAHICPYPVSKLETLTLQHDLPLGQVAEASLGPVLATLGFERNEEDGRPH